MILVLLDEPTILVFERPEHLTGWIEATDVANEEFGFCDDAGQRYRGVITKRTDGQPAEFALEPDGTPDVAHALDLIDRAVLLEHRPSPVAGPPRFADLGALRRHVIDRCGRPPEA